MIAFLVLGKSFPSPGWCH